jgi:hypothetical protein
MANRQNPGNYVFPMVIIVPVGYVLYPKVTEITNLLEDPKVIRILENQGLYALAHPSELLILSGMICFCIGFLASLFID